MKTLPDFVRPNLHILSIGINPSLHAVRAGYPFAFARNRFWPALNASRLVDGTLEPGVAATRRLVADFGIGFTDVVKKPTAGMKDLRAADYAQWAPRLIALIDECSPSWLWFHGKTAIRGLCRHGAGLVAGQDCTWGAQGFSLLGRRCYVSPNPSPANASFSLADLTASYDQLADLIAVAPD